MSSRINVVIIGGSYSGSKVAHGLLKGHPSVKVTLINTGKEYYFNVAAPRVLARPSEVSLDKVLIPIQSAFSQYPSSSFEFVHATVTAVDEVNKVVSVDNTKQRIHYDYLVIASGSTTPSTKAEQSIPTKATDTDDLAKRIQTSQRTIAAAKTICIGGNGAVGVELAGELADAYPTKKITMVSAHTLPLPTLKVSAGTAAAETLQKLGVSIIKSRKVTAATYDASSGQWTVTLNDGESKVYDLYISALGVIPNSGFIKNPNLKTKDGWIIVDQHLAVKGASNMYALGDITSNSTWTVMSIDGQVKAVVANLLVDFKGNKGTKKVYTKSEKPMMLVPVGKGAGTGQMFGWVPWSFMVAQMKSKTFFVPKALSFISA